jgi:hypothetical protein
VEENERQRDGKEGNNYAQNEGDADQVRVGWRPPPGLALILFGRPLQRKPSLQAVAPPLRVNPGAPDPRSFPAESLPLWTRSGALHGKERFDSGARFSRIGAAAQRSLRTTALHGKQRRLRTTPRTGGAASPLPPLPTFQVGTGETHSTAIAELDEELAGLSEELSVLGADRLDLAIVVALRSGEKGDRNPRLPRDHNGPVGQEKEPVTEKGTEESVALLQRDEAN